MDPAKLKVVELRSELASRGLDTKGNKAVLVDRLKEALEKEEAQGESPSDNGASPESGDGAEEEKEEQPSEPEAEVAPKAAVPEPTPEKVEIKEPAAPEPTEEPVVEPASEKAEEPIPEPAPVVEKEEATPVIEDVEMKEPEAEKVEFEAEKATEKSESGSPDKRGEKRKHSPSPSRSTRKRSPTPIKEDEPIIDVDKVQLNWYDSDLHLQVDKENFLSAKPMNEGLFGYTWAGVRATHGVESGKVCFEVKVTEELAWEDALKIPDRNKRKERDNRRGKYDKDRHSSRHDDRKDRKKDDEQNGDGKPKDETTEEKPVGEESAEKMEVDKPATEEKDKPEEEKKEEEAPKEETSEQKEESEEKKEETEEKKEDSEENDKSEEKEEKLEDVQITAHLIRVGWSAVSTGLQLGEEQYSYGFESSGNFFNNKEFSEYGTVFKVGDVVSSYVNFSDNEITISFAINGVSQGTAVTIPREGLPEGFSLFPHVLAKNYAFEVNLGAKEEAFFANPEDFKDYVYVDKVEDMIAGPMRPEKRGDCEISMMIGLPACGKTFWVQKYVVDNADKRYTIIGNTHLLERMTINAAPLKSLFKDRWNFVLDKVQHCIGKLSNIAALRRRNYILDQTNVFPSAQRRKMRSFEGFKRRAVIVVVGDEEQAKRQAAKEAQDGKDVPSSAILEMKASMSLPKVCEWLEECLYPELDESEAKTQVGKYNTQGKEAGFGHNPHNNWKRFNNRGPPRWHDNRRDNYYRGGGGGYRDHRGYNDRYEPRGRPGGAWQPRSGGWRNDRRDHRGGPPPVRDWHNNNRGGGGGGRGRDFDRGVRDGRIQRPQRMGANSYNGNRHQGNRPGAPYQQGGWQQGGGNWGQNYKQRFY